ncbi:anti sigma factor C-terminal domain-containing protein [Alkaliphilus transvaalensis]|uniref:anti sigma factor C-terminal domain-containing protein n=1 Tax=Alkaliphilus transvaalensis TaxID=114628 RepID=UPI00047A6BDE|nr:anti sigma factor C-terminal domain-containing protein [Alkaliphilus transvaalensis]
MDYKDLFNRYKKGLVNDEERDLIEQEIERHEVLEEYLSDVMDEEIYGGWNTSSFEYQEEETSKLKKSVNKRLRKVVLTSVMVVVALYIGIFYVVSGIIDWVYYDPTATTQSEDQEYQSPDFYYDMQAYVSLNIPGYSSNLVTFQEPKGFGKYEVSYSLRDLFTKKEQRHFVNLSRGKLTYAIDGIFSIENRFGIWEGFERIKHDYSEYASEDEATLRNKEIQQKNEKTLRYLNELNPLSYISMSIVFDEDLTMKEFYHMSQEHPSLDFKWVGIRTVKPGVQWSETQQIHLVGFNPNYNDEPSSSTRPDPEKYPLFYLIDFRDYFDLANKDYPEKIYESYGIHFKSRLAYLRNREDYVNMFDYNYYKTDFYAEALKYIAEHGVKTYGVLVFGTAEEFLDSINHIPHESMYINEVLPTKPNIYYD